MNDRLNMLVHMLKPTKVLADIGTDHGYLPLMCLNNEIAIDVIAIDIKDKALNQAKATFLRYGISQHVSFILSDGLDNVIEEVNTVVLSGMGFDLVSRIITKDLQRFKSMDQILIQVNLKVYKVRELMIKLGFELIDEQIIFDKKYYIGLLYHFNPQSKQLTYEDILLGPILSKDKSSCYMDYLHLIQRNLNVILSKSNISVSIKDKYQKQLSAIEKILDYDIR